MTVKKTSAPIGGNSAFFSRNAQQVTKKGQIVDSLGLEGVSECGIACIANAVREYLFAAEPFTDYVLVGQAITWASAIDAVHF